MDVFQKTWGVILVIYNCVHVVDPLKTTSNLLETKSYKQQVDTRRWNGRKIFRNYYRSNTLTTPNCKMENHTPLNDKEFSSIHSAIAFTLLTVSTITIVGNIIVIVSVLCYGKRRNSPDIWVCSLSMVDILHSCIPCSIILYIFFSSSEKFDISPKLCQVQGWFLVFLRVTSCTVVAVMSCQQFLRNFFASSFQEIWKQTNQIIIDVAIWIISAFVASLPLTEMGEFSPLKDTGNLYCMANKKTPFGMLLFSLLLMLMVLTFGAILGSLVVLRVFSGSSSRRFESFSSSEITVYGKRKFKLNQERQNKILTKMVVLVCSIFCICLLPRLVSARYQIRFSDFA